MSDRIIVCRAQSSSEDSFKERMRSDGIERADIDDDKCQWLIDDVASPKRKPSSGGLRRH